MNWQELVTFALVAVAAVYAGRNVLRDIGVGGRPDEIECAKCPGCMPAQKRKSTLVKISSRSKKPEK